MKNPMLFWYVLVGIVLLIFLVRLLEYLLFDRKKTSGEIIGHLRERDIFFIPGDRDADSDDPDDDFDDL